MAHAGSDSTPVDLLVVAAHFPEFSGLETVLGEDLQGEVVTGTAPLRVATYTVGIGLPAAAAGTAAAILAHRPRAVVLLGSYGYYPEATVDDVLQVRAVYETSIIDRALVSGHAALPGPIPPSLPLDPHMTAGLAEATEGPAIAIATTLGVTTDDDLARELAGCDDAESAVSAGGRGTVDGENLELYAVATACVQQDIPLGAMLVSTNAVGTHGRHQWLQHHMRAAALGTARWMAWLRCGAPGMPAPE